MTAVDWQRIRTLTAEQAAEAEPECCVTGCSKVAAWVAVASCGCEFLYCLPCLDKARQLLEMHGALGCPVCSVCPMTVMVHIVKVRQR